MGSSRVLWLVVVGCYSNQGIILAIPKVEVRKSGKCLQENNGEKIAWLQHAIRRKKGCEEERARRKGRVSWRSRRKKQSERGQERKRRDWAKMFTELVLCPTPPWVSPPCCWVSPPCFLITDLVPTLLWLLLLPPPLISYRLEY